MKVATIHANNVPPRDQRDWVTGPELTVEADITYRQVDYWTRTGLLVPITDKTSGHTPGSGHLRRYPADQVDRAAALKQLLLAGVSLTVCRHIVDDVLATGEATVAGVTFQITQHHPSTGATTA